MGEYVTKHVPKYIFIHTAQDYLISGNKSPEQALHDVQTRLIAEYRRWQTTR